jgi:hypothetical protein
MGKAFAAQLEFALRLFKPKSIPFHPAVKSPICSRRSSRSPSSPPSNPEPFHYMIPWHLRYHHFRPQTAVCGPPSCFRSP